MDETLVKRADEIYMDLVKKGNLFGQAFFGHKKTKAQDRRLKNYWKRAQALAAKEKNPDG